MQRVLPIICALLGTSCSHSFSCPRGLSWDENTGRFAWPEGEVNVPRGFTHHGGAGDTVLGHFNSPDGKVVLNYDIGSNAGAYARLKGASSFEERFIGETRVWTARRQQPDGRGGTTTEVAVTFPDAGCANFFLDSLRVEDAELMAHIAQTYHPRVRRGPGVHSSCFEYR